MKTIIQKIDSILFPLTGVLIIVFIIMVMVSLFYPFKPIELHKQITIVQEVIVAGEYVDIEFDLEKTMDIKPTVTWYLVDGFVQELAVSAIRRPTGEQEFDSRKQIPAQTPAGTYHIRIEASYPINILRTVHYSWDTNDFEVVRPESDL